MLRIANHLNEGAPMNRLPPELLTRVFDLAVDRGSEEHAEQVVPLTHVCRHWRTVLLSYPKIWSTVCMKPGGPSVISEWLARSRNLPLTVIVGFTDPSLHPLCRYQDSAVATLVGDNSLEVCLRHKAVLSLDQLLPHRPRIQDLSVFLSSDPRWDEDDNELAPTLLYHQFFKNSLPSLQRLDFRAAPFEYGGSATHTPEFLFAKELPRLRELKYLGVTGGLAGTVKNLTSCEIGHWSESPGPVIVSRGELQVLFDNNKTVKSLAVNGCVPDGPWEPTTTPMTELKFLKISCDTSEDVEKILNCIHAPRFKNLDTVQLSIPISPVKAVATDGSGHRFEFSHNINDVPISHPLRHSGAVITTLRLDQSLKRFDGPELREIFRLHDTVQVLDFDGLIADFVQDVLSVTGVFPGLKVIRVAVSQVDCEKTLQLLGIASKRRMMEGNPLTAIEPLCAEGGGGLDRSLRVGWEKCYGAEGIQNLLSK